MQFNSPRLRRSLGLGLIALGISACGFKDKIAHGGTDGGAAPEDVDQKSEATVTEAELAAFKAPADSSLTPEQIDHYLRTSLTQFDVIRAEAPRLHQQVADMEKRGKDGGVLSGLRNVAEGMGAMAHWGDLIGGSYVRSARTLHYNPAEMEYVRERMVAISGHLMMKPAQSMGASFRQQAEAMKGQPGVTQQQIDEMLKQADEMDANMKPSPALQQNLNALKQARPNVTDAMWTQIGFATGGMGLVALSNLGDPADTASTRKLNEFRTLYTDALNNRVSRGLEDKPAGSN
ncbi:hypothetical protein [Longimicrobium sp.]|uniref:hypothetical protein n=1 Tax=Longimicrobium sp. TaxID=2029185 RepID=UPI002CB746FD|nr:hypothetical protein [Longimicrobium sp.]HSU12885.1 hypothetical protein [Longimicrobium sp.]